MKYQICLIGCDDITYIEIEFTEDEKKIVEKLVELSKENSSCYCQPTMSIKELNK